MNAIDARDLFRIYSTPEGDAAALQGLSLAVREREVLVVLGPSGSGKSTLLRILAGFERPSAGSVRVLGLDVGKLSGRGRAAYRSGLLGYVDQHYVRALAPELSARDLVGLRLGLAGAGRRERLRRADELLERAGLYGRRDARPAELSGGEQQRVAVCAALAHGPRLLLADEPTGELDAASSALVYELIGDLARAGGQTTVIVSHDPGSAAVADRIVHVRDGRLSGELAPRGDESEAIVVGRGGWLRLPEELLLRAGIGSRAVARLGADGILVSAAGGDEPAPLTAAPGLERATVPGGAHAAAQVRALAKRLGRGAAATQVFAGLDACFPAGALLVVTGPSGSGKTTLLNLLAGLELPDEGELVVLGTRLDGLGRAERADFRRVHVGVIGQEPGLVPFLGARENVELGLALRGVGEGGRAAAALAEVGLAERSEQRVARLSAGERQRVAIARALAARPALLLADEPTARLDTANALAVGALFARLARELGTTIVCATHDPLLIEQADAELPLGRAAESPVAAAAPS